MSLWIIIVVVIFRNIVKSCVKRDFFFQTIGRPRDLLHCFERRDGTRSNYFK